MNTTCKASAIRLQHLHEDDAAVLYDFEMRNRAFFESRITPRPADFYTPEGVLQAIRTLLAEQGEDRAYPFLIWQGDTLCGRINLTGIVRDPFYKAQLGYRIDAGLQGRGIASQAVDLACKAAFGHLGLYRLEASARTENPASCRVLEKNGFVRFGFSAHALLHQGRWHDLAFYERRADAPPVIHTGVHP